MVELWDVNKVKRVNQLVGHQARVGAIAFNRSLITTGGRDKSIFVRDIRLPSAENTIQHFQSHRQEVCGLKWSFDGQQLASGGNDNKLFVWNLHTNQPILRFKEHKAAVKAIAWNPHQHGLLASGGGTADKTIRFWNTLKTGSQVCNLLFSRKVNELISTHGYSLNEIFLWKYPKMQKIATLTGHTYRVLYLAMSPDGQTIVTGAGDETLRFWNVFPSEKEKGRNFQRSEIEFGGKDLR